MPHLLETLRAVDGNCEYLALHIQRMNRSRQCLWPGESLLTESEILDELAGLPYSMPGIWKVRIVYDREIRHLEAVPYTPMPLRSVALVNAGTLDYAHKWADRTALDALNAAARQQGADMALFVRDGLITDFFHANAAFFDGSRWWTPARPLLMGTRREYLLSAGKLHKADISPKDLSDFQKVSPVNAMLDLGELVLRVGRILPL